MESLREHLLTALDWLKDRWVEFRARSVFFQVKVGLVAAYLVVVGLTVTIFPVPAPDWKVEVSDVSILLTSRTKILITNLDLGELHHVQVTVTGAAKDIDGKQRTTVWRSKKDRYWSQREPLDLEGKDLKDDKNRSAPASFQVHQIEVHDDGDLLLTWVPPPPGG